MSAAQETTERIRNDVATVAPVAPPALIARILARFVVGPSTLKWQEPDSQTGDETFEERAAIREFDANLSREEAEILARADAAG